MEIEDLRLGNLIRISPRPNEEGILFLAEIHPLSIIGVMLIPRQGYQFRIKFNEMLPLELTEEWLDKFGFSSDGDTWIGKNNQVRMKYLAPGNCSFLHEGSDVETVQHAHQLQNLYFFKTGEELSPKLNSNL